MITRTSISYTFIVAVTFVAGILFATAGSDVLGLSERLMKSTAAQGPETEVHEGDTRIDQVVSIDDAFVRVADLVSPTVVQIRSERIVERTFTNPFQGSPFENFFRQQPQGEPQQFRTNALGSGVFIRSDGYLATNFHVIDGADDLEVMLNDGSFHKAEIVGSDPDSDLAVLKLVDFSGSLPAISFGVKDDIRIGQWVLAFGSPMSEDLGNTVTSGIVSALRRTSVQLGSINPFASLIQTDAAVNPGNSGGPLVNLQGELVGINSAIYSRTGVNQGIAFAIPVDVVRNVTGQLMDKGRVDRGFLGVTFDRVPETLARLNNVPRSAAQVTSVTEGAPADDAGLREGDIITAVNGSRLKDFNELRTMIANMAPGDEVQLDVTRGDEALTIRVELAERSLYVEDARSRSNAGGRSKAGTIPEETLGLRVEDLSARQLEAMGLSGQNVQGVLIAQIDQNSSAFREAELRRGDIISRMDRRPVSSVDEFRRVYRSMDAGSSFMVEVHRAAREGDGSITLRKFFTALTKPE